MTAAPNVVLVVLDTARADALGPYGAPAGASPAIGDLARRGAAARDVFSTANWTFPSHMSMLSGRLPREVGLYRVGEDVATRMAGLAPHWLPSVLSAAGYDTRAVSANPWVHPSRGFDVGFAEFVSVRGTHRYSAFNTGAGDSRSTWRRAAEAVPRAMDAVRATADHGAEESAAVIRRWAAELDRSRPFFWFVNLLECHSPYAPPRRFATLGPVDRVRSAFDHEHVNGLLALWAINAGAASVRPDRIDRMRRAYPGGVAAADAWVERLLQELDEARVLDETLVVITSDHGENLGEAGRVAHALWLDDRLIRVPLVSAGPTPLAVSGPTSLVELPRLIAEAIGLSPNPWGRSGATAAAVAQYDPPLSTADAEFDDLRVRLNLDDYAVWRLTTPSTCATDGTLKFVIEGDEEWVYDRDADPDELSPVRLDGASAIGFGSRLRALRTTALAHAPQGRAVVEPVDVAMAAARTSTDDDELAARMRLLGYL